MAKRGRPRKNPSPPVMDVALTWTGKVDEESIASEHRLYEQTQEEQRQKGERIYHELSLDPLRFARENLAHHFTKPSASFHASILKEAMLARKLVVGAPRGSAKSTLLMLGYPLHAVCFGRFKFIVMVSNTFTKAVEFVDTLVREMKYNRKLSLFGPFQFLKDAEGDVEVVIQRLGTFRIIARGVDQIGGIRGIKYAHHRPDLILVDDAESDEIVRNPEQRRQLRKEFDEALLPSLDMNVSQIFVIGTILHDDSLLSHLLGDKFYLDWKKLLYRVEPEPGASLWPEQYTLDWIANEKANNPIVFAKEYQSDPSQGGQAVFSRDDFRYWQESEGQYTCLSESGHPVSRGSLSNCKAAIACDLAWKERRESDYSVILGGLMTPGREVLLWSYIARKGMRPDDVANEIFILEERLRLLTGSTVPVGFEKAMLERTTTWFLAREMKIRGRFLLTKELKWDYDKIKRIETRLAGRYRQHVIFHRRGMSELEEQLLRFPSGSHDDLPDCAQALIQTMTLTPSYPAVSDRPIDRVRSVYDDVTLAQHGPARKRRF